jgi:hypothetical protein
MAACTRIEFDSPGQLVFHPVFSLHHYHITSDIILRVGQLTLGQLIGHGPGSPGLSQPAGPAHNRSARGRYWIAPQAP